jgi:hypothetical protein
MQVRRNERFTLGIAAASTCDYQGNIEHLGKDMDMVCSAHGSPGAGKRWDHVGHKEEFLLGHGSVRSIEVIR